MLQAATSGSTLSSANNQETVQGQLNRYISQLTEANLHIENGIVSASIAGIGGENFLSAVS